MYKAPRGTADILPKEQHYWLYVQERAISLCQIYGYERIDTPAFEDANLFDRGMAGETDIVDKEMYIFEDRGGNSLALRPEGTAPVCRAYLQHGLSNLPQPVKLYYLITAFRYERPQAGRYRQHHQFGFEAIGADDPALDAEIIEMAWRFCSSMEMGDLSLLLNSIGCRECRPGYVQALRDYYTSFADLLCADCGVRLKRNPLRLLDCKTPSCQALAKGAPRSLDYLCPACARHFQEVKSNLELLRLPFRMNHSLVRGLDYYTRTVFEIQPAGEGAQSTLGGGGRYDGLIEALGGRATPGVGFATGLERAVLNLKREQAHVPALGGPRVFLAYLGDGAKAQVIKLTSHLRQAGVSSLSSFGERSLKAQLKQANSLGVRYVAMVGEDELKNQSVLLRDMESGQQTAVAWNDLSCHLGSMV